MGFCYAALMTKSMSISRIFYSASSFCDTWLQYDTAHDFAKCDLEMSFVFHILFTNYSHPLLSCNHWKEIKRKKWVTKRFHLENQLQLPQFPFWNIERIVASLHQLSFMFSQLSSFTFSFQILTTTLLLFNLALQQMQGWDQQITCTRVTVIKSFFCGFVLFKPFPFPFL